MSEFFVRYAETTQIVIFAAAITILWCVEHVILASPSHDKLRHSGVNMLFLLTALPAELVLSSACLWASQWSATNTWGLAALLPGNSWINAVVVFVALDLCDYLYHRLMHHVPCLWRFHLVHHTDQVVDSSTTVREHPGESVVRGAFLVLWTLLLGASFEVLLLRQAAETLSSVLAHSALRLPTRPARLLGYVFVTPNLHHVHHHYVLPFTDRNFGGVLSIWDRLFGTFAELDEDETIFGLDTHMAREASGNFADLVAMPFQKAASPAAAITTAAIA